MIFSVFEQMYRLFMERGGFSQQCASEAFQRTQMQRTRPEPRACAHGKTALTCPECYVSGFERGNSI